MRYYSGETSSLDAYAIDNQLEADFATGGDHKVVLGGEFHKYTNNLSDDSAYTTNINPWTGMIRRPWRFLLLHVARQTRRAMP